MNGGRNRGPIDIDGCLSGIGYMFLVFFGIGISIAGVVWFFSPPNMVCVKWTTIQVIEQTDIGSSDGEILKDKNVCAEYAATGERSPAGKLWEMVKQ